MSKVNPSKTRLTLPTIEIPRLGDPQSVANSIAQIKEAIEIMSGVRGGKSYFPTYDDATLVQERLRSLEGDNKWETIYNQKFQIGTGFLVVPNLSEYRMLRVAGYIRPQLVDNPLYMQLSSGGVFIGGATDYLNDFLYINSGVATPLASTSTTSVIHLSFSSPVVNANAYGCRFDLTFQNFNQPSIQTTAHGLIDYYAAALNRGTLFVRPASSALDAPLDGLRIFAGAGTNPFLGYLLVEGLKG